MYIEVDIKNRITNYSLFLSFFAVYFLIAAIVDPIPCPKWISSIDNKIPFIWWMIIPYYSYYILLIIPPFLIHDLNKIKKLTKVLIETAIFCYIIYILWPISSYDVLKDVTPNILSFLHNFITFEFLHQNALPSMHVSVTTTIGLVISNYQNKYRFLMISMILGIFLATFLIKQHYLIDSITGLILGYIGFLRYKYLTKI